MNLFDVAAIGELLIDFTYHGKSENSMRLFEQNPGGAPANVLCALSNLGMKTSFIGKVGQDMHGDFLKNVLKEKGVDTNWLISDADVFTTLAFVELSENGERRFSFGRKPGADTCLTPDEVKNFDYGNCDIFHFGSVSLSDEPSRSATICATKLAKSAGAIISCDPNYRAPLWKSELEASKHIRDTLRYVDIIKISDEETVLVTGKQSPEEAAQCLLDGGISCAVVTLGKDGAYAATKSAQMYVPTWDVDVVDTTGAGDAFWGGFLYKLASSGVEVGELGECELRDFTIFANAVASLCVQRRGGIPAMPNLDEIKKFLKTRK